MKKVKNEGVEGSGERKRRRQDKLQVDLPTGDEDSRQGFGASMSIHLDIASVILLHLV